MMKPTEADKDAAYERGWIDSLSAHWNTGAVSHDVLYWYIQGWQRCADYRWQDRNGRGIAPDPTYRISRLS